MKTVLPRKLFVSAIPAVELDDSVRSIALKRIGRLRLNWFLIGAISGVSASLLLTQLLAGNGAPQMAATPSPAVVAAAAPLASPQKSVAPAAAPQKATKQATKNKPSDPRTMPRHEQLQASVKELAITLPENGPASKTKETLTAAKVKAQAKGPLYRGYGVIRSSLFQAGAEAGIPKAAMQDIARAFSYDIDFQRDIRRGDTIEVLMDRGKAVATKGKGKATAKPADTVRYAALTLKGRKYEIFRYNNSWYDAKGVAIKKSLLTTPIYAAQISSGFGMREHPVLGYNKFHRGVDFSASMGTPIMAAGDGVVDFKGWKNGYGNFVVIRHNNTYETAYGHISKFGKIQVGSKVKQGQIIAYVGMTGMATGPHLHYEVRMNDMQVNPAARQFNIAGGLSGKELAQFKARKSEAMRQLAALSKPTQLASR